VQWDQADLVLGTSCRPEVPAACSSSLVIGWHLHTQAGSDKDFIPRNCIIKKNNTIQMPTNRKFLSKFRVICIWQYSPFLTMIFLVIIIAKEDLY
jgi:hypothetical protein